MTVIVPQDYHAREALQNKRVFCITPENAERQDIRPLRVGILNIMPNVETYEFNLLFPLGRTPLQIEPVWIRLNTHEYKSSRREHLENLYISFKEANKDKALDGLIITGAPVGEVAFDDISYWPELQEIFEFAKENIPSTLGICWGGIAIAKWMGINKMQYPTKLFGIYEGVNLDRQHPITGEIDDHFWCPQSRHSGIEDSVLEAAAKEGKVALLAHGEGAGYFMFESPDHRFLVHLGHPEYNSGRIVDEAIRDQQNPREDVLPPVRFDIEKPINVWRSHRNEFFSQWIKHIYLTCEF
ncbi:MAG: homoserine O-succinyltransferase [Fibrobacterales bacterium]